MSDQLKKAFEEREEARLQELEASIEKLRARAAKAGAETKIEILRALQGKRTTARQHLEEIKRAGSDAWDDLRRGFETAAKDLQDAVRSAGDSLKG